MNAHSQESRGIFLGYLAKKAWQPDATWDPERKTGVAEVCSISDCMCRRPAGWEQRWGYNRATCYETIEAAKASVPSEDQGGYSVFAYWLVPPEGAAPGEFAFAALDASLPPLPDSSGPTDFEELGNDVIGLAPFLPPFEHSPLSCNYLAMEVPVNRWCLIDAVEDARKLAGRWSAPETAPEPGTYYVVRVAREPSGKNPPRVSME